MSDRPHVTCLMMSSVDGRLHLERYSDSPDGRVEDWESVYEDLHGALDADAWLVGRVTMAEMIEGEPRLRPDAAPPPPRPVHRAEGAAAPFAVAFDNHARLHFGAADVGGDRAIALLGHAVSDDHLAELAANGVSYVVAPADPFDPAAMLAALTREFGIERLALEGGGGINGTLIEAGLVDELHVLIVPALDGDDDQQGIVTAPGGLKSKARLSLLDSEPRGHGTMLLRYRVTPA